ncbi:hypothetical protein TPHA_0M02020 [Tetrapisispora phaffii CBS 4417]|uniref:Monopolin complex subunit Csm1/Pcs1 C-terminal domain-containing protein n=1 Tax=Tetrapisispora phaffii (strain ATCC 24235 / CBS 4417 / NBRC 1672 / NRRL Y-8282 / UCD 70-5) TaxID=1071381 RepID=G8C0R1_TETPH|nr:hypothetical protein TPHA_0M02020 [Tetrapisispora phaffii CBS 4417]CCE65776.1 hypothetical protein TPHA_0M02020 [Tetrapisispora phaffii CBS 4417]
MANTLEQYKKLIGERLDNADLLVSKLVLENSLLKQQLESKDEQLKLLNGRLEHLAAQEQRHASALQDANEATEIVKDLFEHMCGVRLHKSYEDDTGLWFDTSQGSSKGVMDYKLGFVKAQASDSAGSADSSTSAGGTQVIYVPLLKQRSAEELKKLQEQLPDYMFDTLSFPLASLNQFYTKLTRSLNKHE